MWTDEAVIFNSNRDRLRIAKAIRGRMTAGAGIIVVQPLDPIEPQVASDVGDEAVLDCILSVFFSIRIMLNLRVPAARCSSDAVSH